VSGCACWWLERYSLDELLELGRAIGWRQASRLREPGATTISASLSSVTLPPLMK
jgi:hypothetical protein